MSMVVGQVWEGPLGLRRVNWHVSWVGTKKARLKADLDYGTAVATVTIARWVASPDTDLISPAPTTAPEALPKSVPLPVSASSVEARQGQDLGDASGVVAQEDQP